MADPVRYAVLTVSDRAASGERPDESGPAAVELLRQALGSAPFEQAVLPDERALIEAALIRLSDQADCALIVTTGGTGLAPRDVTPEATAAVIDRSVPGMAEAIRAAGLAHTPHAMLSRGVCGTRGKTLIINLSGSPRAVCEQLAVVAPVLRHAMQTASGASQDCARRHGLPNVRT